MKTFQQKSEKYIILFSFNSVAHLNYFKTFLISSSKCMIKIDCFIKVRLNNVYWFKIKNPISFVWKELMRFQPALPVEDHSSTSVGSAGRHDGFIAETELTRTSIKIRLETSNRNTIHAFCPNCMLQPTLEPQIWTISQLETR